MGRRPVKSGCQATPDQEIPVAVEVIPETSDSVNTIMIPLEQEIRNFDIFASTENMVEPFKVKFLLEFGTERRWSATQIQTGVSYINTLVTTIMNNLRQNASRPLGMYTYKELETALRAEGLIDDNPFSLMRAMCASWTQEQMERAKGILYPNPMDPNDDTCG